jgi:hypothetical protein
MILISSTEKDVKTDNASRTTCVNSIRSEVLRVITMKSTIFWYVTPSSMVEVHYHFIECLFPLQLTYFFVAACLAYCSILVPPKHHGISIGLHGIIYQKVGTIL